MAVVRTYSFKLNILADFDGLLGLDFFKDTDLNISFKRFEIMVS